MPAPRRPPVQRIVIAATVAGAIAFIGGPTQGPAASFSTLVPLLVACAGWMRWRAGGGAWATAALALLMLAPALGAAHWVREVALLDSQYLPEHAPLQGRLSLSARAAHGLAPLVFAGAAALAVLVGRRAVAWIALFVAATAATGAAGAAIDTAAEALLAGEAVRAAHWAALSLTAPAVVAVGALTAMALARAWSEPSPPPAPFVLGVALCGWIGFPPLLSLLASFAPPATTADVPTLAIAPPLAGPALPLAVAEITQALSDRGLPPNRTIRWGCGRWDAAAWPTRVRAAAVLAAPQDTALATLDAAIHAAQSRSVQLIGLVGTAHAPPGPLGEAMSWPTLDMRLDRPPAGTRWLRLSATSAEVISGPTTGPAPCALVPQPDVTVRSLAHVAAPLLAPGPDRCTALAWVPDHARSTALADPSPLSCAATAGS